MPKHKKSYPNLPYGDYNKRNYKKGEPKPTQIGGYNPSVTHEEMVMIEEHSISDRQLSKQINRSVKAIQLIRHKIKVGKYEI